ncbi:MAG: hypothetical protein AAF533_03905 [Acidobacteriota bacterium]
MESGVPLERCDVIVALSGLSGTPGPDAWPRGAGTHEVTVLRGPDSRRVTVGVAPVQRTPSRLQWGLIIARWLGLVGLLWLGVHAWRSESVAGPAASWLTIAVAALLTTLGSPVREGLARWLDPWRSALGDRVVGVEIVPLVCLAVLLLGESFRQVLSWFPTRDPERVPRHRFEWLTLSLAVLAALLSVFKSLELLLVPFFAIHVVTLSLRIARAASPRDMNLTSELHQQYRLVFLGLQAGFVAFGLGLTFFAWLGVLSVFSVQVTSSPVVVVSASLALILGPYLPFIGFLMAIQGRGLWEVSRLRSRSAVFGVLAVLLVLAWPLVNLAIDRLLPRGLLGEGWAGTLIATLVAAGLVALVKSGVDSAISRRFFPDTVGFAELVTTIGDDLGDAEDLRDGADRAVDTLKSRLGCTPCCVRDGSGHALAGDDADAAIVDAVAEPLAEHATVVVRTDDGPVLATRLGHGKARCGTLFVGPRRSGLFYNRTERRLLSLLADQLATLPRARG